MSMTIHEKNMWTPVKVCPTCKKVIDKSIVCYSCLQQFLKFNVKINFSEMKRDVNGHEMIRIHINGNKLILGPYCLYSRVTGRKKVYLYTSSIYHKINKLIEKSIQNMPSVLCDLICEYIGELFEEKLMNLLTFLLVSRNNVIYTYSIIMN